MRFGSKSSRLLAGLPVVVIAAVLMPETSIGGELRNLVRDLYGGDGMLAAMQGLLVLILTATFGVAAFFFATALVLFIGLRV